MSKNTLFIIVVMCSAHGGYRRAGIAFAKGRNEFSATEMSDSQLQAIKGDAQLLVTTEPIENPSLIGAGAVNPTHVAQAQGSVDAANSTAGVVQTDISSTIAGVVTEGGEHKSLADLTVPELKEMAASLDIAGFKGMNKTELVAAIATVQVQVPTDAEPSVHPEQGAQ